MDCPWPVHIKKKMWFCFSSDHCHIPLTMAESLPVSSSPDLPKIASITDAQSPTVTAVTHPAVINTSHTKHSVAAALAAAIVPSSNRGMACQSSVSLVQSSQLSSSMDSLIDSLVSPAHSPTKKGKTKAADPPQPVASSLNVVQNSGLPDYLLPNPSPGKCESVESAMRHTETNFTILASKLDVMQTTISDDIKGLRAHLTQLASDFSVTSSPAKQSKPAHSHDHKTLSDLITSQNHVVEVVTELKGLAASVNANNASLDQCFTSVESAVAALQPRPGLIPAEKRAHYENTSTSTLVPAAPTHFEYPHIPSRLSNNNSPEPVYAPQYAAQAGIPNAPTPYGNTSSPTAPFQTAVAPQYAGHTALIPNAPAPYTNMPASNRSRVILIRPMVWGNPADEVVALLSLLPNSNNLIKRNFIASSTNNPHFVKIMFSTPRCYTWRSLVLCSAQHQKQKTRKMQRKVRSYLVKANF